MVNNAQFHFDEKPPDLGKWFLYGIIAIIIFVVIGWALSSCNVYNKLNKHVPLTTTDSNHLSAACVKTFPASKPIIKQGKTIVRVVTKIDSSNKKKYLSSIDSLLNVIKQKDTCHSINIDSFRTPILNEASNECNPFEDDSIFTTHDTAIIHSSEDSALIFNLRTDNINQSNEVLKANAKIKDRNNLCWILGGMNFLFLIGLGFSVAKIFQKQTATR
jgi:hypothetical protein